MEKLFCQANLARVATIRYAESLPSDDLTLLALVSRYEDWPEGSGHSYSRIRIEYRDSLLRTSNETRMGERSVSSFIREAYPNNHLQKIGISALSVRNSHGPSAWRRLAPLDQSFKDELEANLTHRGIKVWEDDERAAWFARDLSSYLRHLGSSHAPLLLNLEQLYEGMMLATMNAPAPADRRSEVRKLDYENPSQKLTMYA